jgi:hypothetical protein
MAGVAYLVIVNILLTGFLMFKLFHNTRDQRKMVQDQVLEWERISKQHAKNLEEVVQQFGEKTQRELQSIQNTHAQSLITIKDTNQKSLSEFRQDTATLGTQMIIYSKEVESTNTRLIDLLKKVDQSMANYQEVKPLLINTNKELIKVVEKSKELVNDNEKTLKEAGQLIREMLKNLEDETMARVIELSGDFERSIGELKLLLSKAEKRVERSLSLNRVKPISRMEMEEMKVGFEKILISNHDTLLAKLAETDSKLWRVSNVVEALKPRSFGAKIRAGVKRIKE